MILAVTEMVSGRPRVVFPGGRLSSGKASNMESRLVTDPDRSRRECQLLSRDGPSLEPDLEGGVLVGLAKELARSTTDGDLEGSRPLRTEKKVDEGLSRLGASVLLASPPVDEAIFSSALMRCEILEPTLVFAVRFPPCCCCATLFRYAAPELRDRAEFGPTSFGVRS